MTACKFVFQSSGHPSRFTKTVVIGQAKAFDSSSLTLRLQRLNAGLEALEIVNQNITENLSAVQELTSTESVTSYQLGTVDLHGRDTGAKDSATGKIGAGSDAKPAAAGDGHPNVGLTAGDPLTNQLNLVSHVFNLQPQYEGSLSDRMFAHEPRLQTVLGFQVSITTPSGYEDCVAIVEMAVRKKAIPASGADPAKPAKPVSLVALMPQEKTYTAETTANVERSLQGSAVLRIITLGLGGRRGSRGAFIRRDPDTVAFERNPLKTPRLLDDATTFRFSLASQAFGVGEGLDFQGMEGLSLRCLFWPDGGSPPSGLWFIVRMSPPSYPSAWLLPSRARFRFT
jgi:hypothetical protein